VQPPAETAPPPAASDRTKPEASVALLLFVAGAGSA